MAPPPSNAPPPPAVEAPVDEPVRVRIDVERAYKMGERATAATREAYLADVRDRRHWNDGGTGKLSGSLPGVEGHPDPRVIVKIEADDVRGLHRAASLQVIARRHHWMPIVRCYRLGAYKDPQLRGWTKAQIAITRSGRVIHPKLIDSELSDEAVSGCIVAQLTKLRFARVRSRKKIASRAVVHMRVAPGDEPLPPPAELIVPGEGELPVAQMRAPVSEAKASFETCYRAAFDYAPGLWGRIVVRFHLRADGTVDEAFEGGSRFPDKRMLQCVLRAARSLTFKRPKNGDLRFVVPLRFSSPRADTSVPSAK